MSSGAKKLRDEGTQLQATAAGAIAGLFSRFCIAPLDVVKINLQLQTRRVNFSFRPAHVLLPTIRDIFKHEGLRGFWRGNIPAEGLYLAYCAIQFSIYSRLSHLFKRTSLPAPAADFASGAIAGGISTTATYPLDLLRTRFAARGSSEIYRSLRHSIAQIVRQEGYRGFFQGLPATIVQVVPYMGLFFASYEALRPRLAHLELPFGGGDAAAGFLAGTAAKTGVFPLDLIRKRQQVQGPLRSHIAAGSMPEYQRGIWLMGRAIVASEGWRGLYKGLGISVIKAAPASAITVWCYGRALKELRERQMLA